MSAYQNLDRGLNLVITTRMQGLVFTPECGTPAVAIDAIAGGAKVSAQARALDWPVPDGSSLTEQGLGDAVAWAFDDKRKIEIAERQERALKRLEEIHSTFTGLFEYALTDSVSTRALGQRADPPADAPPTAASWTMSAVLGAISPSPRPRTWR